MATSTGKKARKAGGNRYACKRRASKRKTDRTFGHLPYSVSRKNVDIFQKGGLEEAIINATQGQEE
jgi:hypothetical protein